MIFGNKELWVITLDNTQQRTKYTTDLLEKNNFKYKIFTFSRNKIPWKGCLNSHIFLYREALKNDLEYIIIVEDNICLSPNYDTNKYEQLLKIIDNKKLDVIIIGGFITPLSKCRATEYSKLFKTKHVHGTSSYIISKIGYMKALEHYESNKIVKPIDIYLSSIDQYIYNPLIFHHRIIPSIANPYLDNIRKFWFRPKVYQFIEFLYFNNKLPITTIAISFVFIMIFVISIIKIFSYAQKRINIKN